jgi:hypothetical protein
MANKEPQEWEIWHSCGAQTFTTILATQSTADAGLLLEEDAELAHEFEATSSISAFAEADEWIEDNKDDYNEEEDDE